MDKGNKIGEAYVEISADVDKLKPGLDAAKRTVEQETAAMGDAADKNIGGGFTRAGQKIEGATAPLRKFSGALSSTAGIATSLIGAFAAVGVVLSGLVSLATSFERKAEEARKRAEEQEKVYTRISGEFERQIALLNGAAESQLDYQAKWKEINGLYAEGNLQLIQSNDLLLRLNEIRVREIGNERDARIATERAVAAAAAEARKQAIAENRALEDAQLEGIERVNREEENARRATLQKIADTEDQLTRNALERRLELIEQIAQKQRDAIAERERLEREADAERERRAAESAQKQADALASALTGAYERIASQQRVNDARLLGSLTAIQRLLEQTRFQGQHGRSG